MTRSVLLRTAVPLALGAVLLVPGSASALTVTNGQLSGGQLRVEGSGAAPGIFVTVTSSASAAGARSDTSGRFKVETTGFSAPDCTVVVSDRQTPIATVRLSGCTPTVTPPPATPPPPSGACVITPGTPASYPAGDLATYFFTTTGCVSGPLQWTTIAGSIPTGMTGPFFQGQTAGAVSGRPTLEGVYAFTVQATDGTGSTDTETFSLTITAPRPMVFTTPGGALAAGSRGKSYTSAILRVDGGVPGYAWSVVAGALPGGLRLSGNANGGTVAGIPTTRGTFPFTVRATDSRGATADRAFSITIT